MNKDDLQRVLIKERFNPRAYSLEDEKKDETLCLRFEDDKWSVYYTERGMKREKEYFADENSACEFFLNEMRDDPTTKADWKSGFSME